MSALKNILEVAWLAFYILVACGYIERYIHSTFPFLSEVFVLSSGYFYLVFYGFCLSLGTTVDAGYILANKFFNKERGNIAILRILIVSFCVGGFISFWHPADKTGIAFTKIGEYGIAGIFTVEFIANLVIVYCGRVFRSLSLPSDRSVDMPLIMMLIVHLVTVVSRPYTFGGAHLTAMYSSACAGFVFASSYFIQGRNAEIAFENALPFLILIAANFLANIVGFALCHRRVQLSPLPAKKEDNDIKYNLVQKTKHSQGSLLPVEKENKDIKNNVAQPQVFVSSIEKKNIEINSVKKKKVKSHN